MPAGRRLGGRVSPRQARAARLSREDLAAVVSQVAGGATLELGERDARGRRLVVPLTAERAVVVCEPSVLPGLRDRLEEAAGSAARTFTIVDATCKYAAMTLVGPLAREVFARFTAIDLRPKATPVGAFRPVSIARTPGMLVREGDERFLFLFGAALGAYMWETVADAGAPPRRGAGRGRGAR